MDDISRDPTPDPRLASLRDLDPSPAGEVDWARLRASIASRAELPLARRRALARREGAARRLRVLVPAAAAAGITLAVLMGAPWKGADPGAAAGRVAVDTSGSHPVLVDEVVEASYPAGYVDRLVSGRAEADALLLAAVGEGGVAQL